MGALFVPWRTVLFTISKRACMGAGAARRGMAAARRQGRKKYFKVVETVMREDGYPVKEEVDVKSRYFLNRLPVPA